MYGYIYLTTNLINNKKYIGRKISSKFLENKYLGSGIGLKRAVKKYGKENFSVKLIEECDDYDSLVEREIYWIKYYDAVKSDEFYNESHGGYKEGFVPGENNIAKTQRAREINSKAHKGKSMPIEIREKISKTLKGHPGYWKGKKGTFSPETLKRMSILKTIFNKTKGKEIYKKISESAKGNKMMNKNNVYKRVHPHEFDKYLNDGWVFGGVPRTKNLPTNKKGIHKGNMYILVPKEKLDEYIKDGWALGKPNKENN